MSGAPGRALPALACGALLAVATAAVATTAAAHTERTAYLELVESSPGDAVAVFKLPAAGAGARAVLPRECDPRERDAPAARPQSVRSYSLRCPGSLRGRHLAIEADDDAAVDLVVVRARFADGTAESRVARVARGGRVDVLLPGGGAASVALTYARLGVLHILSGLDHLLFVLALFLLARSPRALVIAVTAFTAAHSLTLAAAALGLVHVSRLAAEACIAASLVLVALDLGAPPTARAREPTLAFGFGLVHGLGFAGALSETGLPAGSIPLALASFNAGVEVGQLAFVGACALAARLLRDTRAVRFASYATGTMGTYLFLERLQEILRAR